MADFAGKESKTSEQLKMLSLHVAAIATDLHKTRLDNHNLKDALGNASHRIGAQHQQLCEMSVELANRYESWTSTATRYAKTLDWIRELCGGLGEEAAIAAEDLQGDSTTSAEIIDSLEGILHNFVTTKTSEMSMMRDYWENKVAEMELAILRRDMRITDLETAANNQSKRRSRKRSIRSISAGSKPGEIKAEVPEHAEVK